LILTNPNLRTDQIDSLSVSSAADSIDKQTRTMPFSGSYTASQGALGGSLTTTVTNLGRWASAIIGIIHYLLIPLRIEVLLKRVFVILTNEYEAIKAPWTGIMSIAE
jgi:hypothetical protein